MNNRVLCFRCSTVNSRLAAYEVLVMLADSSPSNLQLITKELLSMHHQLDPALSKEFDVSIQAFFLVQMVILLRGLPKIYIE